MHLVSEHVLKMHQQFALLETHCCSINNVKLGKDWNISDDPFETHSLSEEDDSWLEFDTLQ